MYDLFGNGKTAVKANFGKYLQGVFSGEAYTIKNPATTLVSSITRSVDRSQSRSRIAQCDFLNPAANQECGPWSNLNWGASVATTRVNPAVLEGWGVRNADWQFGVGIQHEILPRMSIDVSYNRRSWSNFFTTNNAALTAADWDQVTLTAPLNPLLPNGGGYPVTFLVRNARQAVGVSDPYYTTDADFGDETHYWHGVDVTFNARLSNAVFFQGGTSTGRGVNDTCQIETARFGKPMVDHRRTANVRLHGALADAGARPRQLYRSEGGRAVQCDLPVAAQRAAGGDRRRDQRGFAHRHVSDDAGAVSGGDRRGAAGRAGPAGRRI